MKHERVLTPSEVKILEMGAEDPDYVTGYFFRPRGSKDGFLFDRNFVPGSEWQKRTCLARQADILIIGGFATGKTLGFGIMGCYWSVTTQDFRFLNVAPTAYQAQLMYREILDYAKNTPFQNLIWKSPKRPFPTIVIRFYIGDVLYESTMEFMSADKNAESILSWSGDWVHIDEAGLIDDLETLLINLGSRVRGHTPRGRERLGRISLSSNSWDNPYLWYRFDLALETPEEHLSIVVATKDNKNVTERQLERLLRRIPEDERARYLEGTRPEGRGLYFSKQAIYNCEDRYYGEQILEMVKRGAAGYAWQRISGAGPVYFTVPPKHGVQYMLFGDPGTGNAPNRNAPVLQVWEITPDFPGLPARLAALWWGFGHGDITPFVNKLLDFREIYRPFYIGVDTTGPQKNTATLLNLQLMAEDAPFTLYALEITDGKLPTVGISGMDFSGSKKFNYLNAHKLLLSHQLMVWPKQVIGIRSQLSNYDPKNDRKIPQDIVACQSMSAQGIYAWFNWKLSEEDRPDDDEGSQLAARERRLDTVARERRRVGTR